MVAVAAADQPPMVAVATADQPPMVAVAAADQPPMVAVAAADQLPMALLEELPDACLQRVLLFVPARERHAAAARVSPRWRDQCVLLALRARAAGARLPPLPMSRPVARRVRAAQERIDPEAAPEAWSALGFGERAFEPSGKACCGRNTVPAFDVARLDVDVFRREFAGQLPVLITGLAGSWPATQRWSLEQLWRSSAPGSSRLRVGDDDQTSRPVRLAMRDYLQYLVAQTDDDPLYLFDEDYTAAVPAMRIDYTVPAGLFADDVLPLYASLNDGSSQPSEPQGEGEGEEEEAAVRPASRKWLLIGPAGSGTDVHTDPDGTSAWNSCVHGMKRWAFIHPSVPEADVLGPSSHYKQGLPAQAWFTNGTLEKLVETYPEQVQEVLQGPGSMVYIPEGWWHVVWNLEDTVAVTHNSISRVTFEKEWHRCEQKQKRKQAARRERATRTAEMTTAATLSEAEGVRQEKEKEALAAVALAGDAGAQEEAEAEMQIVSSMDRLFGFEDVPSTLKWCRLLRGSGSGSGD